MFRSNYQANLLLVKDSWDKNLQLKFLSKIEIDELLLADIYWPGTKVSGFTTSLSSNSFKFNVTIETLIKNFDNIMDPFFKMI